MEGSSLSFPSPFDRLFDRETVETWDRVAARHGWSAEGIKNALWTDRELWEQIWPHFREPDAVRPLGQAEPHFFSRGFAWHVLGRPTFCPTPGLLEALSATDLKEAPSGGCPDLC